MLDSFLHARGTWYYRSMSSPLSAERACSRLSPHLAFGTISPKTAVQAARQHAAVVRAEGDNAPLLRSLQAFDERLHWRSHFIQKLEDEPRIEYESIVRQYDELRPQVKARGDDPDTLPFVYVGMINAAIAGHFVDVREW